MNHRRGGMLVLALAAAAGCSFDQGGVAWDGGNGGGDAAGTVDARPGPDARIDAATPPADAAESADGVLVSRRTTTPPTLDADAADWDGAEWTGYAIADSAQFGWRHASYDDTASIQFASFHDTLYIYFFFAVTDDLIRVDSTLLYEDDAVSVYLDAAGDRSGPYGIDDHELVINANGIYDDYAPAPSVLDLSGTSQQGNGGYQIELRLTKASLGAAPVQGMLGFDVAITDDDGFGASGSDCHGLWFLDPGPHCAACCSPDPRPWCDTSTFGRLVLEE